MYCVRIEHQGRIEYANVNSPEVAKLIFDACSKFASMARVQVWIGTKIIHDNGIVDMLKRKEGI